MSSMRPVIYACIRHLYRGGAGDGTQGRAAGGGPAVPGQPGLRPDHRPRPGGRVRDEPRRPSGTTSARRTPSWPRRSTTSSSSTPRRCWRVARRRSASSRRRPAPGGGHRAWARHDRAVPDEFRPLLVAFVEALAQAERSDPLRDPPGRGLCGDARAGSSRGSSGSSPDLARRHSPRRWRRSSSPCRTATLVQWLLDPDGDARVARDLLGGGPPGPHHLTGRAGPSSVALRRRPLPASPPSASPASAHVPP